METPFPKEMVFFLNEKKLCDFQVDFFLNEAL